MLEPMDNKISENNVIFEMCRNILDDVSNFIFDYKSVKHTENPDCLQIYHKSNGRSASLVYDGRKIIVKFNDNRILTFSTTLTSSDVELIIKNFEFSKAVGNK